MTLFFVVSTDTDACTLSIPSQNKFKIRLLDKCHISVRGKNNYFALSYFKATNMRLSDLIKEGVDIATSENELYLPIESVDDANYTVKPLSSHPLRKRLPDSPFLESRSTVYVISMPKKRTVHSKPFSLDLECLEAAGGTDATSFTTRYCTPHSNDSNRELDMYRKFISDIKIRSDP